MNKTDIHSFLHNVCTSYQRWNPVISTTFRVNPRSALTRRQWSSESRAHVWFWPTVITVALILIIMTLKVHKQRERMWIIVMSSCSTEGVGSVGLVSWQYCCVPLKSGLLPDFYLSDTKVTATVCNTPSRSGGNVHNWKMHFFCSTKQSKLVCLDKVSIHLLLVWDISSHAAMLFHTLL